MLDETSKVSQEQTMNTVSYVQQTGIGNNGGDIRLTRGDDNNGKDVRSGLPISLEQVVDNDDDDHDDEDEEVELTDPDTPAGPPSAKKTKKTKGRVKIKMEFIDNKLRRYTTFSKRKTGIMKKAYELSTLTGTQVMLLVASETGHVYTFATRKLQPMITSESGKALIQTCLNSPDPPAEHQNHHRHPTDQRMSATGFEETELSYAIGDEDGKITMDGKPMFTVTNVPGAGADVSSAGAAQAGLAGTGHTFPMTTYLPTTSGTGGNGNASNGNKASGASSNFTMALQQGGFTTILPPGTAIPAGATAFPTGLVQLQGGQLQPVTQSQTPTTPTIYRLAQPPAAAAGNSTGNQILTAALYPSSISSPVSVASTTSQSTSGSSLTMLSNVSTQPPNAISTPSTSTPPPSAATPATPVMYQTPQGVVYATSPGSFTAAQPGNQPIHITVPMISRFASGLGQGSPSKEGNNNTDHHLSGKT
ncbi:uncharacterized protein [Amphiura filiformis]|uniref:uncharacterized protein isoform X2 n=1 Tax=Amphiura filiformis TaxID=82378 RepID=UPI003B2279AA